MTYDEALAFWYGRINYEVKSAVPGDLKLERMRALLRLLGDPHHRVRLVHVTGTKGKGSTCAMIAQILRCAGYRVGLFTSPHLEHVEERVQVDSVPISHTELAARIRDVAGAVRTLERDGSTSPTFFEIGTALGFLHFCYRRCDIAVIEVGLGGRFDSTNICRPLVSVITNIGWDHTAQLGNTLEAIAYQKAGIIKHRIPVVSGVSQAGPREVIRRAARELDAPLTEITAIDSSEDRDRAELSCAELGLLGQHQFANASLAREAVKKLQATGMHISQSAVRTGLATVYWPARIEVVSRKPAVILDTAHNVPSAEALVSTLRDTFPHAKRKSVILGVSSDKQYAEIIRILAGYFDDFYLTKYSNNPRSVSPEKLVAILNSVSAGTPFHLHAIATEAWSAALKDIAEADLLCVTGSVFLAGELRSSVMNFKCSNPKVAR
jgi:dihydrofolate synthase/folylpolyglutamate synthase